MNEQRISTGMFTLLFSRQWVKHQLISLSHSTWHSNRKRQSTTSEDLCLHLFLLLVVRSRQENPFWRKVRRMCNVQRSPLLIRRIQRHALISTVLTIWLVWLRERTHLLPCLILALCLYQRSIFSIPLNPSKHRRRQQLVPFDQNSTSNLIVVKQTFRRRSFNVGRDPCRPIVVADQSKGEAELPISIRQVLQFSHWYEVAMNIEKDGRCFHRTRWSFLNKNNWFRRISPSESLAFSSHQASSNRLVHFLLGFDLERDCLLRRRHARCLRSLLLISGLKNIRPRRHRVHRLNPTQPVVRQSASPPPLPSLRLFRLQDEWTTRSNPMSSCSVMNDC